MECSSEDAMMIGTWIKAHPWKIQGALSEVLLATVLMFMPV